MTVVVGRGIVACGWAIGAGSGDIQSLADLANSFAVIRTMRVVSFTKDTLLLLLVTPLAPMLLLTLTMVPLD